MVSMFEQQEKIALNIRCDGCGEVFSAKGFRNDVVFCPFCMASYYVK